MSKFNVGDKVRIKGDLSECEFGYTPYMDAYKGKEATVIKVYSEGKIKLDIDKHAWCWSENVLELIEENDNMNTKIEEGNKVNESDLKDAEISKEVKNDVVNPFMEEYKKIVTETMNLCEKKNKDYGSSVEDTFKKFGDISYLVRITDKYNRILTLINKDNEVKDENLIDTIRDMGNYLFLWLASKRLRDRGDKNE